MGKKEKLIARFKQLPKDFTYDELKQLVGYFGYSEDNQGRTSGSRVTFRREKDNSMRAPERYCTAAGKRSVPRCW